MAANVLTLNWLGIGLGVLAASVLGGLWFTLVVARPYASALGRAYDPALKPGPLFIFGPMLCTFVTTVTSSVIIEAMTIQTYQGAAAFGAVVGVGYFTAILTNIAINPNIPRPFLYSAINAPYFIASSIVVSLILVAVD